MTSRIFTLIVCLGLALLSCGKRLMPDASSASTLNKDTLQQKIDTLRNPPKPSKTLTMQDTLQEYFERSGLPLEKKQKALKYIPVAQRGYKEQMISLAENYPAPVNQAVYEGAVELMEVILGHSESHPKYSFQLSEFPCRPFFNDEGVLFSEVQEVLDLIMGEDLGQKIQIIPETETRKFPNGKPYELWLSVTAKITDGDSSFSEYFDPQTEFSGKKFCQLINKYLAHKGIKDKKVAIAHGYGYGASDGVMVSYVYVDRKQYEVLYRHLYIGFFEGVGNFGSWEEL